VWLPHSAVAVLALTVAYLVFVVYLAFSMGISDISMDETH
jgi:hypothetical protein